MGPDFVAAVQTEIAPRAEEDGAHDVFDVLFCGDGEVLGASGGEGLRKGFFEADGFHAQGDGVRVREFEGFVEERLGVVLADLGVPVYLQEKVSGMLV